MRRTQLILKAALAVVVAVSTLVVAAPAAFAGTIYGEVDAVSSPQPGLLRVTGWAFDDGAPTTPLRVHVYVGGPAGSGAQGYDIGYADQYRPDIADLFPGAGAHQGIDRTFEVAQVGQQPVFVYYISSSGNAPFERSASIQQADPGGQLSPVVSPAPGRISVSGWAFDQSDLGQKVKVVVTAGGQQAGVLVADQRGPGFEDFPVVFAGDLASPGGDVTVCATVLNVGVGSDQTLGCQQVRVEPLPPPPPPPVATPPTTEPQSITLRLKAVKKKSKLRVDIGPDRAPSNYRYIVKRKAGKKWRTVRRSQTVGPRDRVVLDLPRGKYRVVVPRQHGLAGAQATARLKR